MGSMVKFAAMRIFSALAGDWTEVLIFSQDRREAGHRDEDQAFNAIILVSMSQWAEWLIFFQRLSAEIHSNTL